jgi:hypothetical protein
VILVIGAILLTVLYYLWRAFNYAEMFPNHALLEGAQLLRAIEYEMNAKDRTIIDATATPLSPPPGHFVERGNQND